MPTPPAPKELDGEEGILDKPAVVEPVAKAAEVVASGPIHVVALRAGFFKCRRLNPGDKFTISDESQFSKNWMQKI